MVNNFKFTAPFPWFGGKSRVSDIVWQYFGDVQNYIEPFAGSLAVLLGRPTPPKIETVNDIDCYISNFWRALANDPEQLAEYADWPVNEADLHARHRWLVMQKDFKEKMRTDPDFYDVKIAGWWVWGISQWIGGGWCRVLHQKISCLTGNRGINRVSLSQQIPCLTGNRGINRVSLSQQRPHLTSNQGINRVSLSQKKPFLSRPWQGIHQLSLSQRIPHLSDAGTGIHRSTNTNLLDYFNALSNRLRRVRVCCGDWSRVLTPCVTMENGLTGIFLDPPYSMSQRDNRLYNEDNKGLSSQVREWAIENGNNPLLRIALCGYEGEHQMPDDWIKIKWKAGGGYGSQGNSRGRENRHKERIWFSPNCLKAKQLTIF